MLVCSIHIYVYVGHNVSCIVYPAPPMLDSVYCLFYTLLFVLPDMS